MQSIVIIVGAYLVLNAAAFLSFGKDKRHARSGKRRTSENRLLLWSMLGPLGAFAAMHIYRHKTRDSKFLLVPLFLLLHLLIVAYLVYSKAVPLPALIG
jgi:uncharacterized membrane protein YsdA (DUF1294 family)